MITIRGTFLSGVIDKLPLPDVMKKEIKTIPQVHCEYQQVDRDSKYDNLQSTSSEIDPLTQSKALIAEGNFSTRHSVDSQKDSSTELIADDSRTGITAEVTSQTPTSVHSVSSPLRIKAKKEIPAY